MKGKINNLSILILFLFIFLFSKNHGQTLTVLSKNETFSRYLSTDNCFYVIDVLSSDNIMYVDGDTRIIWGYGSKINNISHTIYSLNIDTPQGYFPIIIGNGILNLTIDLNCYVVDSKTEIVVLPNYHSKRLSLAPYSMLLFKGLEYYIPFAPIKYYTIAPIAFNSFPIEGNLNDGSFTITLKLYENSSQNLPVYIDYNITSNYENTGFNISSVINKFPNVQRSEEVIEFGYKYSPLVTITIETKSDIDPAIAVYSIDEIDAKPIFSNLTHKTYIATIEYDFKGDSYFEVIIKNDEGYISLLDGSFKITEKKIEDVTFIGSPYQNDGLGISINPIFTSGINASSPYDFSEFIYSISDYSTIDTQLSWPYGFEKGSNDQYQLKFSILFPSNVISSSYFYLSTLEKTSPIYTQILNRNPDYLIEFTLNSFESIWLYEFKFLFKFGIDSSFQPGKIVINEKNYRQEYLIQSTYVPPPTQSPGVALGASASEDVVYEIVIDTVFYYPFNFLVFDRTGNSLNYFINDYTSINPIIQIEAPKKLKDIDIYSVSNIEYLFNDVDITNRSVSNIMYFNFPNQNVDPNRPMALVLMDAVSANNLKNTDDGNDLTGTSKIYYSKWNSTKKMFQIEFTIPANTQTGILPWFITFSSDFLISEGSVRRPSLLASSPIFTDSFNLDQTRLYSSFLKTSDQLYVKTNNFDGYGPIFTNITSTIKNDYVSWIIQISDPINGFSSGDITIRGETDSSTYNFHLTPSNALGSGDKWNADYELKIYINPSYCITQTYIITKVNLLDTLGNRASFSVSGLIIEPLENPFINYLDNSDINKVTYDCIKPISDSSGPELLSFNVIPGPTYQFNFSAFDLESGLKPNQRPIVYISTIEMQTLQCVSEIIFLNDTFANYSCSIDIPHGFGYTFAGQYIVSVYGFINNAGLYSGYSTETLNSLGFDCVFDCNYLEPRLLITDTSSFNENDSELWIFGGEFNIPIISYQNVSIVFSNGSKQTPSITNSLSSALLVSNIRPTNESFTVQVIFYDEFNQVLNKSNIFTVNPTKHIFITPNPIPIPDNPRVECMGSPVCGGEKNGYCSKSVGCVCYSPWVGLDCSSKVIIIPTPKPNESEPTSEIPILENGNSDNIDEYLYKSLVSVVSLRELDYKSKIINNYIFDRWNFTKINTYTNQYLTEILVSPSVSSNNQKTTTTINVTLQWFKDEKNISFANQPLNMKPSSIKYTIEISNYQFRSQLNQLQLVLSASFQSSNSDDICSSKEFGETSSIDNSNYLKIQVGDHSLYGRFIKRAIVDNLIKSIGNEILNQTTLFQNQTLLERSGSSDYSFIGITIPYYRTKIILDPDFSVLLDSGKVSKSDQNSICNSGSSKSGLSKAQLAGIIIGSVGFAIVVAISVTYHFMKNKKDSKFQNQMQNKLKEIK
ncbi:hypothetical protein RB653_001069 [Dictyostelium firmibasis]|uniref:EGF-like domain-containing protein n=1 Tax=Dictyostelium firmibasis TaxID=79012 RepID=A0AAN7YUX4_9MYCE